MKLFMQFSLVSLVLAALAIACGGYDDDDDDYKEPQPASALEADFQANVKPVLDRSCGGSSCHTSGTARDGLIKSGSALISSRAEGLVAANAMPKPGSAQAEQFSAGDKQTVLGFIVKYK